MKIPVAKFEKVSFEEFKKSLFDFEPYIDEKELTEEKIKETYNSIILPKRATAGSAGYDFYSPFDIAISKNYSIVIPTGIKVQIGENWFLACYPRSGLGFKYEIKLANTVGIIDSDYYYADNEGHIMIKLVNGNNSDIVIRKGDKFAQGVFQPYGVTVDDNAMGERKGGFGSTDSAMFVQ